MGNVVVPKEQEMANPRKVKPVISELGKAAETQHSLERLYMMLDRFKQPISYEDLAQIIRRQHDSTLFVLDNSFIPRHEIDTAVWDALFEKRVVIPPFGWDELQDWLDTPFSNKSAASLIRAAEDSESSRILLDHETPWPEAYMLGRQYYVTLLSDRKQRAREVIAEFATVNGRPPSEQELNGLWQKAGTDRDFHLLRKGAVDLGKPNFFADEDVVVTAAMVAFSGGCNTTIFTRDGDVLEQFQKLIELLTIHYQALLFADLFADNPQGFASRPMPKDVPELEFYFDPERCQLIRKHVENPDEFVAALLPNDFAPVLLTCVLLGGRPPEMTRSFIRFIGERDMHRVFQVKGQTQGLSTCRLSGRNCHVTGFPKGIDEPRNWVILGEDRYTEVGGVPSIRIAHLDRAHTNWHVGQLRRLAGWRD
jgi:hypothetical protein